MARHRLAPGLQAELLREHQMRADILSKIDGFGDDRVERAPGFDNTHRHSEPCPVPAV